MTTQYEDETIFEAPFSHETGLMGETAYESALDGAPELLGETAPGTHEVGFGATYETGYETSYEFEGEWELGGGAFETGSDEGGPYETGSYEGGPYETGPYEQEGSIGNLLSGALGALGLGEEELVGEAALEWSGETSDESDQFLGGKLFKALRGVVGRVLPQARRLLPGAMSALGALVPGGALLSGPAGTLLGRLLAEGEGEVAAWESQMFGNGEALGEVNRDERSHEAALTEILANEAVVAESEDEAASILATTLPITITIMGGRRVLRPVIPAYAQAQRRLVSSLRSDPQSRQLLRAIPSIDRRAVWLMRRWNRTGRPITGPVAVNALAAATRDVLGDPRRLRRVLLRNGAVRIRNAPLDVPRLSVYRPGATAGPTGVRGPAPTPYAARRGY